MRNLYVGQEATIRTKNEQQNVSKLGKEYIKAVYCRPAYLIYLFFLFNLSFFFNFILFLNFT